jgi:hypothetical protein
MRCLRIFDISGSVTSPRSNTLTGPQHSAAAKADVQEVAKERKAAHPTSLGRTKGRKNGGKKRGQNRKLTDREKKENHIQGEKKRRALIRQGFEDLRQLVPELRTDKYIKSTTLFIAADWLEDIIQGDRELRAQIAILKGHAPQRIDTRGGMREWGIPMH